MSPAVKLNSLSDELARQVLGSCCAAPQWIARMLARRPFADDAQLIATAVEIWNGLDRDQWLAAFAGHPKIGDMESLKKKFASTAHLAAGEQAGTAVASQLTLRELAEYNQRYEAQFGYIFIVCATGKTADEMLDLLKARIVNEADVELPIAGQEQLKITLLRLQKLAT